MDAVSRFCLRSLLIPSAETKNESTRSYISGLILYSEQVDTPIRFPDIEDTVRKRIALRMDPMGVSDVESPV